MFHRISHYSRGLLLSQIPFHSVLGLIVMQASMSNIAYLKSITNVQMLHNPKALQNHSTCWQIVCLVSAKSQLNISHYYPFHAEIHASKIARLVLQNLINLSVSLARSDQWAFCDSTLSMFCLIFSVFFLSCRWRCSRVRMSMTSSVCVWFCGGVGDCFNCRLFPEAPGLICAATSYELY